MTSLKNRSVIWGVTAALGLLVVALPGSICAQSSSSEPKPSSSQSSSGTQFDENGNGPQSYVREKSPTLVDPAGPTISLVSTEQVFSMAAGLNMCGYDEGLQGSAPVRQQVRDEINKALAASEDARKNRDALCLYIAQHRMTGTQLDVAQYISLSLYLSPQLETTVEPVSYTHLTLPTIY